MFFTVSRRAAQAAQPLRPLPGSGAAADPKETASAAIKKLAEQPSFGWTTAVVAAEARGPFGGAGATTTGWTETGGYTRVAMPSPEGGQEFVTRGGKSAVRCEGNWQTLDQATARAGGGQAGSLGQSGFDSKLVTDFKLPATQAEEYLAMATTFTRDGDAVTAVLSAETVNALLAAGFRRPQRGGRPGGGNPNAPIKDPKGIVIFRISNGVLNGFTLKLAGSRDVRPGDQAGSHDHNDHHGHRFHQGRSARGREGDR